MLHAYYELFLLFGIKVRQVFFESIPSTAIVQSFAETENYELGSKLIYNTAKWEKRQTQSKTGDVEVVKYQSTRLLRGGCHYKHIEQKIDSVSFICYNTTLFILNLKHTMKWIPRGSVVLWLGRRTCDSMVVSSIPGRLVLERVTVFGHAISYVPGQLSLLPSVGREMSTGKSAVMLCGWGVKAGWLIPIVDKRVSGR